MARREWGIRRNRSISPRQLALAYSALCATSLPAAVFFMPRGTWYALVFSVLEISAVGCAFAHFGRHGTDRERIVLTDNCLLVELVQVGKITQFRLARHIGQSGWAGSERHRG